MNQLFYIRQQFMQCKDSKNKEQYQCHYDFYQKFLAGCQDIPEDIEKYSYLKFLSQESEIKVRDIYALLTILGEDIYCDNYIKDLLRQRIHEIPQHELITKLQSIILDSNVDREKLMCVLEISAEHGLGLLSAEATRTLLGKVLDDIGVAIVLLAYIESVHLNELQETLMTLWHEKLPDALRVELCAVLGGNTSPLGSGEQTGEWYDALKDCLSHKKELAESPFTIIQFMFYGDLSNVGEGNSGGLSTFLGNLGNAMAQHEDVDRVVTIALYNTKTVHKWLPLIEEISPAHFLLRVPIFLEGEDQLSFIGKEYMLQRSVLRMLRGLNIRPSIFHVRYLDNASKAMISLAEELGIPVVATLTPDPHRSVTDSHGDIAHLSINQAIHRIHRIYLGDYIVEHVQGILGIGGPAMKKELLSYFPQLLSHAKDISFACIPEGIPLEETTSVKGDSWKMFINKELKHSLSNEMAHRPLIINVGRFNEVKGQDRLLKAWGDYGLWESHNLVIIGGNLKNPNAEEQKMIMTIDNYLFDHPNLRGRFCLLSACNNKIVRHIEREIANHGQGDLPTLYVCPSLKEEFGISIIEAMAAGLVVMAPSKGGAHTYIRHGENGFLIETQSAQDIYQGIYDILFSPPLSKERIARIQQKARETIQRNFSIQKIADEILAFYQTVKRAVDDGL